MIAERLNTVAAPDGRTVAFALWGDREGFPIFGNHGCPGCRLDRWPDEALYADPGVLLVTRDRPGYAKSTRRHGRSVVDDVDDVVGAAVDIARNVAGDPRAGTENFALSDADEASTQHPEMTRILVESGLEWTQGEVSGWVDDSLALPRPWGFEPGEVDVPVLLSYGLTDVFVPPGHRHWLASQIPRRRCDRRRGRPLRQGPDKRRAEASPMAARQTRRHREPPTDRPRRPR